MSPNGIMVAETQSAHSVPDIVPDLSLQIVQHGLRTLAKRYAITLQWSEACQFRAVSQVFPGIASFAPTAQQAIDDVVQFVFAELVDCVSRGVGTPPVPDGLLTASESESRTAQINVRVSPIEKAKLETAAIRKGFSNISDYIRSEITSVASSTA